MLSWTPTGLEPASRHPTKGPRAFRRSPAGLGLNAPSAQVEAAGASLDPDGARTRFPASHERPKGLSQEPCRPRIERAFGAGGGSGFDAHYPFQNKSPQPHGWGLLFWSGRRGSNPLPPPWQGGALPDELRPQNVCIIARFFLLVNYNFTFSRQVLSSNLRRGSFGLDRRSSASKISTISAVSRSG